MSRPSEVYVRALTEDEHRWLQRIYHHTTDAMLKIHCHILLLSAQHYSVPQIANLLFYSEDVVVDTIHDFNRAGLLCIHMTPSIPHHLPLNNYPSRRSHKAQQDRNLIYISPIACHEMPSQAGRFISHRILGPGRDPRETVMMLCKVGYYIL